MSPPELADKFMFWLEKTLLDRKMRGDGWWELRGAGFSIAHWMVLFRQEMFGAGTVSQEELDILREDAAREIVPVGTMTLSLSGKAASLSQISYSAIAMHVSGV